MDLPRRDRPIGIDANRDFRQGAKAWRTLPWYLAETVGRVEDGVMCRADELLRTRIIVHIYSLVSTLSLTGDEITVG